VPPIETSRYDAAAMPPLMPMLEPMPMLSCRRRAPPSAITLSAADDERAAAAEISPMRC